MAEPDGGRTERPREETKVSRHLILNGVSLPLLPPNVANAGAVKTVTTSAAPTPASKNLFNCAPSWSSWA